MKKISKSKLKSVKSLIKWRFIIFTVVMTVLAAIIVGIFVRANIKDRYERDAQSMANVITEHILKEVDLKSFLKDKKSKEYKNVQAIFSEFCEAYKYEYLYIYVLTDDNRLQRCLITTTEEENLKLIEENHFVGSYTNLEESEKKMLAGKSSVENLYLDNKYGSVYAWEFAIKDNNGKVIGFLGMDKNSDEVDRVIYMMTALLIIWTVAVVLVFHFFYFRTLETKIFRPIKIISERMDSYVEERKAKKNDNHPKMSFDSGYEIQSIVKSFYKMSDDITNYIDEIRVLGEEKATADAQMDAARKIQFGFVPPEISLCGENYGASAFASPAKSVGGDFYDSFTDESEYLYGVIGDVSGKGITAAMFMAIIKSKISDRLGMGFSPARALNIVNNELCIENPEGMFATVFAYRLSLKTGVLEYANAGHTKPILISGDKAEFLSCDDGIVLGLFEDADIKDEKITLNKGDYIFTYTDGVTEAVNAENQFFGEQRLLEVINGSKKASTNTLLYDIEQALNAFTDKCESFDDVTMLCSAYGVLNEIKIECNENALNAFKDAVSEKLGKDSLSKRILLACEELIVNIYSYSGADYIKITFNARADVLYFTLKDNGVPFNPLDYNKVKEFEELSNGGMGISIAKQLTHSISYEHKDNENCLTLCFKFSD